VSRSNSQAKGHWVLLMEAGSAIKALRSTLLPTQTYALHPHPPFTHIHMHANKCKAGERKPQQTHWS